MGLWRGITTHVTTSSISTIEMLSGHRKGTGTSRGTSSRSITNMAASFWQQVFGYFWQQVFRTFVQNLRTTINSIIVVPQHTLEYFNITINSTGMVFVATHDIPKNSILNGHFGHFDFGHNKPTQNHGVASHLAPRTSHLAPWLLNRDVFAFILPLVRLVSPQ